MGANPDSIFFYSHYIYLNGKHILFPNEKSTNENIETITLSTVRKKLENLIPKDTVFLQREEEIDKRVEDKIKIKDLNTILGLFLFSRTLYDIKWFEIKINPFANLKLLEKNESFNIYEYPQKKVKGNHYYTIIILGNKECNENFIDGFLNYLFNIKKEDDFRVKLEKPQNKEKIFIQEYFIHCDQGYFKFISINYKYFYSFYKEEVEQILELLNKENEIILFVINSFSVGFIDEEINLFQNNIEKIEIDKDMDKSCIYIVEPNDISLELKSNYYMKKLLESQNKEITEENKQENRGIINNKIMEEAGNLFSSNIIYPDSILVFNKNSKIEFCAFTQTMEGYSNFYEAIIKRKNKIIDFSNIKSYLTFIKNEIGPLNDEKRIFSQKKEKFEELSKKHKEFENWLVSKKNENIRKIKKEIENIKKLKKEIEENNNYLIQIESYNDISNSKSEKNFCKFNIVLNNEKSKEKENKYKISIKSKTIDNILEQYYNTKIEDQNLKIQTLIQNMEKDIKDCEKYYDDILTKIYNGNYKNTRLMSKFSNEYNKKIMHFNRNVRFENIKTKIGNDFQWFDEFLVYIFEFFLLKKLEFDYEEDSNPCLIF